MDELVLATDAKIVLNKLKITAEKIADRIDVLPLETPEQEAHAVQVCAAIKRLISEGETARKKAVAPYKDKAKKIDAEFRGPRQSLERLEKKLKLRIAQAVEGRRRAIEEASRNAFEAMRKGDLEKANTALATTPDLVKHKGTIERWSWEIKSFDVSKVPCEYLTLNSQQVKEYLKTVPEGGEPSIPGIEFERKVTIGVRK